LETKQRSETTTLAFRFFHFRNWDLSSRLMEPFEKQAFLLAEDNDHDVFLMQTAFPKAGLSNPLQVVNTGDDAIAYLEGTGRFRDRRRYPFPLVVLLDLELPGKSGFDVLRWMQHRPFRSQLVAFVLTASHRDTDASKAYSLGTDFYLTKPTRFEDLVELTRCLYYWVRLNHFTALSSGGRSIPDSKISRPASRGPYATSPV
jgi:CheY-like chemotaxis protein